MENDATFEMSNMELVAAIDRAYAMCRSSSQGEGVHPPTLEHYKKLLTEQHRRAIERRVE